MMGHRESIEKTVLITGATGFLGKNLLEGLLDQGWVVVALVRKNPPDAAGVLWVEYGSAVQPPFQEVLERYAVQAVVHCAGKVNGTDAELREANEEFTSLLVSSLAARQPDTPFVYISSVSAIESLGTYGRSKRKCEDIIQQSGLRNWTILRPTLLYGRYDTKNVAGLVKIARLFPVVPVPGKSFVKLQPLFVGDLVGLVCQLVATDKHDCRVYTVAGPYQEYLWDMIGMIQAELGKAKIRLPVPLWPLQKGIAALNRLFPRFKLPVQQVRALHAHPPYVNREAEKNFGFHPKSFAEGIRIMLQENNRG